MKRFAFFLLAFCLMAAGCNDTEQKPILPKPKVTVEIAKADIRTIDLTLSVLASGNELDSWGIVYCETDDREKGNLKNIGSYMEEIADLLDESQELNFKRWKILNQHVHMNFQALGSYEAELGTVRNHINTRLQTLDQLIRR